MTTYTATIKQESSGAWIASIDQLPECHTFGATPAHALRRLGEAAELFEEIGGESRNLSRYGRLIRKIHRRAAAHAANPWRKRSSTI